jgi:hypothetical protein
MDCGIFYDQSEYSKSQDHLSKFLIGWNTKINLPIETKPCWIYIFTVIKEDSSCLSTIE